MSKHIFLCFLFILLNYIISIEASGRYTYIYNKKADKYLNPGDQVGQKIVLGNKNKRWYIPNQNKPGFFRHASYNICLNVKDTDGTVVMGNCDNNAIFKLDEPKISTPLLNDNCLDVDNNNNIKLNKCNGNSDQMWELEE